MRRRALIAAAAALVALLPVLALTSAGPTRAPQDKEEDTVLSKHMEAINDAYRKLRSSLKDPERNDESLAKVVELQTHAFAAKVEKPFKLETTPADEHKAFLIEFRKEVVGLIKLSLDLEVAVLEDRNDDAAGILKEINKLKNPAHKKFKATPDK